MGSEDPVRRELASGEMAFFKIQAAERYVETTIKTENKNVWGFFQSIDFTN